jgi:hypothetical protein
MASAAAGTTSMIFCFFSTRLFDSDFRRPLIEALIAKGYQAWHIRIGRQNILTQPSEKSVEFVGIAGFFRLIRFIQTHSKIGCVVFVDTTGAFVPVRSLALRAALRGLWCFDIFDNLLYDLGGFRRLRRWLEISLLTWFSPIKIVLSRETLRLFPTAYHLENAAHTARVERAESSLNDLVCLFMIDRRFDFALVKEVATLAPALKIHLYGRLGTHDRITRGHFEELCASYPNVIYRGEYGSHEVDTILVPFGIGFTPYATNSALTEFINPDKYYLFLNSGMEVISTDIPQARRMSEFIHIAGSAMEVIQLAARIRAEPACRKNRLIPDFGWERRADDLVKIVRSHGGAA